MKLTLLNQRGVSLKYGENSEKGWQWWSSTFVNITPPDLMWENEFMGKNLVWSKITESNKITLKVFLTLKNNQGEFLQVGNEPADKPNIMRNLREIFKDKVKFSVCIKASAHPEGTEEGTIFVFQEGLTLGEDYDFCERIAVRVNEFNLNETRFDISVFAHISDDHAVIRGVEEKIPVSLKIARKILENGLDSNIVIIAGNGVEIKSHKSFLTASSPVFERMFANEMEESKTGRVDMTDLSEEGVKAFLRYLYCGDRIGREAEIDLAFELLYASHKYEVSRLEQVMISYWMELNDEKICAKFAFKTYMFVRSIEAASELKMKMVRILHGKYDELKTLPEYDELYKTPGDAKELCECFVKAFKTENKE